MLTLLRLDSSPMGTRSISRKLTYKFVDIWRGSHADGRIIERDLTTLSLPVIDGNWVASAYTPEQARTAEQIAALGLSDLLVRELQEADEYVLGVPMHNFSIPSTLKLWIDQVVRVGKTIAYGSGGPIGLLSGKKATLLLASGGVYAQGSALESMDFVTPYLKAVLRTLGITDVTVIAAEGTAQLRSGNVDPQNFLAPSFEKVQAQAGLSTSTK
jgi:FMN-dependent NADH-azoreductase